jgi:hypothetical protein
MRCGVARRVTRSRLRLGRGKELARSQETSVESNEPSPEGNITPVYDFTYDGGGLYKRGTGTLSITRRHVRARDDLLRTEPQSNELGTLRSVLC